jgi:adenylate cyclase
MSSRASPAGGEPHLQVFRPDGTILDVALNSALSIGRNPTSDLQLADPEVSKDHAVVEPTRQGFRIRDLDSSNGTFVNHRRVQQRSLANGDEILVGSTRILFRFDDGRFTSPSRAGVTVIDGEHVLSNVVASVRGEEAGQFLPADEIVSPEALRADYEKVRLALEFQRQVGGQTSVEAVLAGLLDFAFGTLRADNGAILVKGPSGRLDVQHVRRRPGQSGDLVVSATLLGQVMDTREGFLTADAVMDQRFLASQSIVAHGIRAAMAVPLLAKGEVLGVIFLDTRERTGAFAESDLRILAALGAQAAVVLESADLQRRLQAEERQRENLARFLPPVLVDQVAKGEVKLADAGELREVTILFADIRGFTPLAETQPPEQIVRMLKEYFEMMAETVFRHRGIVDKFIGDALMALWGAPERLEDAPLRACRAAQEMQNQLLAFNAARSSRHEPPIGVGIGINSGPAVVGLMGSSRRPEYTAIGDTVNVASRLCGLAKAGQVLTSGSTVKRLGGAVPMTQLADVQVKGRAQRVSVFEVSAPGPGT